MNRESSKPEPPKPCPVCLVAMQATEDARGVTHRCERCGTVITVGRAGVSRVDTGRRFP